MTTILGIDPGSRITGYGIIQIIKNKSVYLASGCIRITEENLGGRLKQIFAGLQEIIQTYSPTEAAIERIFMHANVESALKLGQARGVAIVATALGALPLAEYTARQVKQAVVGHGAAKKEQVQHMVQTLLNLKGKPQADAADALGIALCHAHSRQSLSLLNAQPLLKTRGRYRRGRIY